MPHLILECSDKLVKKFNFNDLFKHLHEYLAESLPTKVSSCKSRVIAHDKYFVADDFENKSFAHLTVKILPGRTDELKKQIGEHIHSNLKQILDDENTSVSVDVIDLSKAYCK